MKIIIQTPDFKASRKLTAFVERNVEKLGLFDERILEARVCLKTETSDSKRNKACEIRIVIPGNDLFASRHSDSYEDSVKAVVEALRHQIDHQKTIRMQQQRMV